MAYVPTQPPSSPSQLQDWLRREFDAIAQAMRMSVSAPSMILQQANNEPSRILPGMVVYADGTNWDPAVGEGLYWFVDEHWVRIAGSGSEWVDIDFPIIVRTTGAGIPTLATVQDNLTAPQWQVGDINMCESQELIHGWVEGSRVYFHLHLITNGLDATNRYVAFEVEYAWANVNGTLSTTATITTGDLLIPANTPDKTMLIMSLGNFVPTNGRIGGHVLARLKRVAASGTAPSNDPWIPMLQLHIQVNTAGSAGIGTKWIQNTAAAPRPGRLEITGHAPVVLVS